MPRAHLIKTSELPYHVHARTNNKDWFKIPMADCWKIFEHELANVSRMYKAKIILFVLMSNHFHMIIQTPLENINEIMNYLLREVAKGINKRSLRINHVFGGPYKWSLIKDLKHFGNVYKYVYQNPIRSKLVERLEDYEYSTLYCLLHKIKTAFPLYDEEATAYCGISKKVEENLVWLNESFTEIENQTIKSGIRKSVFQLPRYKQFKRVFR